MYILDLILGALVYILVILLIGLPFALLAWWIKMRKIKRNIPKELKGGKGDKNGIRKKKEEGSRRTIGGRGSRRGNRGRTSGGLQESAEGIGNNKTGEPSIEGTPENSGHQEIDGGRSGIQLSGSDVNDRAEQSSKRNWEDFE